MRLTSLHRLPPIHDTADRTEFARAFYAALDSLGVAAGEPFLLAHPDVVEERVPEHGKCFYCGGEVGDGYRRSVGWERKAKGNSRRGGSDIVAREAEDVWACQDCVHRKKLGVGPEQGSLIA